MYNTPEITKIIISHRVTSLSDADQIFVLDEGHIVESGTHDELIALDAPFKPKFFPNIIIDDKGGIYAALSIRF